MTTKTPNKKPSKQLFENDVPSQPLEKMPQTALNQKTPLDIPAVLGNLSLKDFIDDYQKLLSIIGFFAAFGLVWKQLINIEPLNHISYLCFLITASLLFEVFKGFNRLKDTLNAVFFKTCLYVIFVGIVMSLIFAFPVNFREIIVKQLYIVVLMPIIFAGEKIIGFIQSKRRKRYEEDIGKLRDIADNAERHERNKTINDHYIAGEFKINMSQAGVIFLAVIISIVIYNLTRN